MSKPADWRGWLVAGLAGWELLALFSGRVPTITRVWHTLRTHREGRLIVWIALGWLIEHLFGEDRHCPDCPHVIVQPELVLVAQASDLP